MQSDATDGGDVASGGDAGQPDVALESDVVDAVNPADVVDAANPVDVLDGVNPADVAVVDVVDAGNPSDTGGALTCGSPCTQQTADPCAASIGGRAFCNSTTDRCECPP